MFKTLNELPKYFRLEDAETQRLISKKYSDAMIVIDLRENLSLGQRRKSYGRIFGTLVATEFDREGDFPLGSELEDRVDRITVYRGSFEGPKFDTASAGYVGDLTINTISAKFGKNYQANSPIHLLAYIDSHPMLPDDVWLEGLVDFLDQSSKQSQFEAIWVYDLQEDKIKHEWRRKSIT